MNEIHIYAPQATDKSIDVAMCIDCKKRTRMLSFYTTWHGWDSTCIRCGRRWSDGEWMPLDFCRWSRQSNIDQAKRRWRRMMEKDGS